MSFHIMGTGSYLPARSVTNDELSAFLDTSDEWIRERTGIHARRVCTTETLDDLAAGAAERALADAGVAAADLDLLICSTTSADHLMPAEACVIQERIGATCPAYDISAACAGFVFALDAADGTFCRGRAERILVVSAERCSRYLDWSDRATCVLFGDGAAAAVLGAGGESPLALKLATSGDAAALDVPGLAGMSPFYEGPATDPFLSMAGRRVFKFGVNAIVDATRGLADEAGIGLDGIDHFVFHQANRRILDAAVTRLGIDDARVAHTLAETGNISSACIPLALDRLSSAGELADGDLVALVGFGAGLDVGSCLLRWGPPGRDTAPTHA
jgi:3-oxoacyl-[acyl-carrier-protein] synthase-3